MFGDCGVVRDYVVCKLNLEFIRVFYLEEVLGEKKMF